ncbi:serine/threonine-protein phosphatase [Streptomyces cocklensis]|uniref:Serine phosphatase RsbU, regulator of sigma subunit n=1 Tax=Actinacidiphila cocklensis TaxID=887465 RepID=A0A9W4DQU7_9ACTN|nr:PP2C family protein-serine/threonine phosphatase [Actinacidiphila cocklensis]MDD1062586.1 serine/threonine-protein phosphatase [Actinacidiphila cocklensis]WSX72405.1 serine/threonine-protein phosphatase [Streptomyces sp. NBC_00899]WSX81524.1 serine/threonine-protein phosphatase [Streptomyces sp. NBC_00899]CAG6391851.1 Serine phosphatase RsbU, regulator of sigma subunit [Actinacidiphila cocklensis]
MARLGVWAWVGKRKRLLPAFLLLFAVVIDLGTPRTVSAAALYAAAVLSAAPLLSQRGTIVTGACALLADWAMFRYFGYRRDPVEISELAMVAAVTVLAAFLNRLLYHQREQLESVRDIAAAVQRAVLPSPPGVIGSLHFAAYYEAAQTDAQIGGDLYAVVDSPYGVRCMIGDVRGKGMDAVRSVAVGVGTFREAALEEPSLAGLVERLERAVALEAEQSGHLIELEGFVTGVLAEFRDSGTKVQLLNRGHPAPLLLDGDTASYLELSEPGLPLGLAALVSSPEHVDTLPFPQGAALLLYTDGLSESRDAAGLFYDPLTRLRGRRFTDPDVLLRTVVADVHRHTGGRRTDDMALLAITRPHHTT